MPVDDVWESIKKGVESAWESMKSAFSDEAGKFRGSWGGYSGGSQRLDSLSESISSKPIWAC